MIRVAKKDTKILIADKTEVYLENQYKKSQLYKEFFKDQKFALQ